MPARLRWSSSASAMVAVGLGGAAGGPPRPGPSRRLVGRAEQVRAEVADEASPRRRSGPGPGRAGGSRRRPWSSVRSTTRIRCAGRPRQRLARRVHPPGAVHPQVRVQRRSRGAVRAGEAQQQVLAPARAAAHRQPARSTVASAGTRKSLCRMTDPARARSSTRAVFQTVSPSGMAFMVPLGSVRRQRRLINVCEICAAGPRPAQTGRGPAITRQNKAQQRQPSQSGRTRNVPRASGSYECVGVAGADDLKTDRQAAPGESTWDTRGRLLGHIARIRIGRPRGRSRPTATTRLARRAISNSDSSRHAPPRTCLLHRAGVAHAAGAPARPRGQNRCYTWDSCLDTRRGGPRPGLFRRWTNPLARVLLVLPRGWHRGVPIGDGVRPIRTAAASPPANAPVSSLSTAIPRSTSHAVGKVRTMWIAGMTVP